MKIKWSEVITALLAGLVLLVIARIAEFFFGSGDALFLWFIGAGSTVVTILTTAIDTPLWQLLALIVLSTYLLVVRIREKVAFKRVAPPQLQLGDEADSKERGELDDDELQ